MSFKSNTRVHKRRVFKSTKSLAIEKISSYARFIIYFLPHGSKAICDKEMEHEVDASIMTTESVFFDAVFIPGGKKSIEALSKASKFSKFVKEAYKHCKAIAVHDEGKEFLDKTVLGNNKNDKAIIIDGTPEKFIQAIARHRNWDRKSADMEIAV